MVMKAAENFLISVTEHNGAQSEAHDEECDGLQTIEVVQGKSSGRVDYSSGSGDGSAGEVRLRSGQAWAAVPTGDVVVQANSRFPSTSLRAGSRVAGATLRTRS